MVARGLSDILETPRHVDPVAKPLKTPRIIVDSGLGRLRLPGSFAGFGHPSVDLFFELVKTVVDLPQKRVERVEDRGFARRRRGSGSRLVPFSVKDCRN